MMNLRSLQRAARRQGWRIERTRNGHLVWVPPVPGGDRIVGACTPSDHRALRNLLSLLRRAGLEWPRS